MFRILRGDHVLNGYRAEIVTARKAHRCDFCPSPIVPGEQYYSIILGGGGLASIKFPHRAHLDCIEEREEVTDDQGVPTLREPQHRACL